jgi:hypothetical protein
METSFGVFGQLNSSVCSSAIIMPAASMVPVSGKQLASTTSSFPTGDGHFLCTGAMVMKRCTKCKQIKPLEYFDIEKRVKDGRTSQCKRCRLNTKNACRQKHPDRQREYNKRYYEANADGMRNRSRAYRESHRDQVAEYNRKWYAEHKELANQLCRNWYQRNKERVKEQHRQYYKKHPEKNLRNCYRRRALIGLTVVNRLTRKQWEEIKAAYKQHCAYCGCKPEKLTQDHVIPLSKGGLHTANNVVPACPQCNIAKKDKIIIPTIPSRSIN